MKKLICVILSIVLVLSLCACEIKISDNINIKVPDMPWDKSGGKPVVEQKTFTEEFCFSYKGTKIYIDENMKDVLEALGEPQKYFEAESCAFKGLDKVYTYSGFIISTNPYDDGDHICSIYLSNDSVSTYEGIHIGSSLDDLLDRYGAPAIKDYYSYTSGCTLNFILDKGSVISIEYLPE